MCTYGKGINTTCLDSLTCQTWNYFKTLDLSLFTIVQWKSYEKISNNSLFELCPDLISFKTLLKTLLYRKLFFHYHRDRFVSIDSFQFLILVRKILWFDWKVSKAWKFDSLNVYDTMILYLYKLGAESNDPNDITKLYA